MLTINLFDSNFPHQSCSVAGQTSQHVHYVRDQMDWDGITVFTDGQMYEYAAAVNSPIKVGWLHEGRALHPENYEQIDRMRTLLDEVWTYDQTLIDADPAFFKLTIRGGCWVPTEQWGLGQRTRHAALILSEKTTLPGHRLRQEIAAALPGLDLYGPAYTPIGIDKAKAYRQSLYAVVVEPVREVNYFTEHLLDALACGCMVFYWGCPNIRDFLDPRVIIPFETVNELQQLLAVYGEQAYSRRGPVLRKTLMKLPAYSVTEDWQATHRYPALLERVQQTVPA